jgi:DNA-binding CsgD family transcriptional regulator
MELLERDTELAELATLLGRAENSGGHLVLLGGEAGVGKTALVQQVCAEARARAQVLVGACDPLSTPRPLGPLLDVAPAAGGELARLVAEDTPRHALFQAVLATLTTSPPTLFVIEDAHWADEATLDLLRFLGRRVGATRSLVIVTYRDDEVGPGHPLRAAVGDLATAPAVRRIAVSPLSETAVRQLAADSDLDPGELYRRTGGNPFFVTEVLAVGGRGIPPTIRDAVLARAGRLSPAARAALEAAAIIGATVEIGLLAEVIGPNLTVIDECLAVGLLQAHGGGLGFRHELARVAIIDALSPHRAAALHRTVLAALRRSPAAADLTRLAHHAEGAADQAAVLEYAPAAARQAAALGAHREAAAQYGRALRYASGLADSEREPLLMALLLESHLTGQAAEAITAGEALAALARRAGNRVREAEVLAWQGWVLVMAGRNADAERASRVSLELLDPLPPGPDHAFCYFVQATLRMLNRDIQEAIAWGERALALAERFEQFELRVRAMNTVGAARLVAGDETGGRTDLERSRDLARQAGLDAEVASAFSNLGSACGEIYRFAAAESYLTEGIAYAAERDLNRSGWYMVAWLSLVRLYQGRWSEAADTAASVLRAPDANVISRIMALVALGRVRARRGDPDVATTLDEALALAAPTGTLQRLAPVHAARAEAAWLAGDRERAGAEARAAHDLAARHGHRWFVGELGFWRWRAGEEIASEAVAPTPFDLQIAGDWRGAAAAWRELSCPYEAAQALAASDDVAALREALAAFEQLGARPATQAVKRRLHELGVRDIPRGPRPTTLANPAHLTAREAEILGLIATGDTNSDIAARLYLSPKTVEHHVSSILSKLRARSRREAVQRARALGVVPPN